MRQDAFAGTFLPRYERFDTIREPTKAPGWVATTGSSHRSTDSGPVVLTPWITW